MRRGRGAPKNPKNLWPEPHSQSKLSDPLETKLKRQVCKGLIKPAKARAAIRLFKNTEGCVARLRAHQPAITARDIDLFLTREAAEAELRAILSDEPGWGDVLLVLPIELDSPQISAN